MKHKSVLIDTSFFIRFLSDNNPLYRNADGYYRYLLEHDFNMLISTISVAEYCVGGNVNELPLKNLQILPFNFYHAKRAGEFAKIIFDKKNKLKLNERNIIPNDTKLFAQADFEDSVGFYLSSDSESKKIYEMLKLSSTLSFQFIDLTIPHSEFFGILDL